MAHDAVGALARHARAFGATVSGCILLLTRHGRLGSSSRLRLMQYIPWLEQAGWSVQTAPFFSDAYVRALYAGRHARLRHALGAYLGRRRVLHMLNRYRLIWIEKEVFPFLPAIFEQAFVQRARAAGCPYVIDYDDATFHRYDQQGNPLVRRLLARKLDPLVRGARLVTVGNAYLGAYMREAGASKIVRLPTVVDLESYPWPSDPRAPSSEPQAPLRIGWIGSPPTTPFLELVRAPLQALAAERAMRLVTMGADTRLDLGVPMESHPWSEDSEAAWLANLDIGIMPLPDAPFERGKCGYKLIQYMAAGKPVVASPVGVNRELVSPEVGLLATSAADWLEALRRLGANRAQRQRMGQAGRALVERAYCLQAVTPQLVAALNSAVDD